MKKNKHNNRRSFFKKLGASALAVTGAPYVLASGKGTGIKTQMLSVPDERPRKFSANDKIRIGCIGVGGMGLGDTNTALETGGVEMVAACDLYESRLVNAKEEWGKDLMTTMDYQEILDRDDIDAVIVATSDHWHKQISVDAMKKGKAVYCEKPMPHNPEEGHEFIKAQQETGQVFQVGSQFASGILYAKAKELVDNGEIGELNFVEAKFDRHSARGAWQYHIPPNASEKTVDWDTYISNTTKRPWDSKRFFRWRNYTDYGTGVAGDLFIHLITMLHTVTGSKGPNRVVSTGGLRYWKDGRDVPDIQIGMYDYPETENHPPFNLVLRSNFVDGSGGGTTLKIVGSEGAIDFNIGEGSLVLHKDKIPQDPGLSSWAGYHTWPKDLQEEYMETYRQKYPEKFDMQTGKTEFRSPGDYKGDRYMHFKNFFHSMREGTPVFEDAVFGLRAAGPALVGNQSYFDGRMYGWDPEKMEIIKNI